MNRKDKKLQEENIAAREKGLIIVQELERVVRTFNEVLKDKDDCAKSMEADLQGLGKTLEKNLDSQRFLDRNLITYDNNINEILLNLQHLEDEERTYAGQYECLLKGKGIEIEDENQEPDDPSASDAIPTGNDNSDLDSLEKLRNRREKFLQNLNQEFKSLEENLVSIVNLRTELEESRNEIKVKKAHALEKKASLEEEGEKLLNKVGRLESELETTIREEKNLIEQSVKMIKQIENNLELDENTDHVLFSSLSLAESAETTSTSETSGNGHKIAIGT
jgi:chromosome segregation ATPase